MSYIGDIVDRLVDGGALDHDDGSDCERIDCASLTEILILRKQVKQLTTNLLAEQAAQKRFKKPTDEDIARLVNDVKDAND